MTSNNPYQLPTLKTNNTSCVTNDFPSQSTDSLSDSLSDSISDRLSDSLSDSISDNLSNISPKTPNQSSNNILDIKPQSSHYIDDFISDLSSLYPQFTFIKSSRFKYRPSKTIYLGPPCHNFALLTLHELGHALSRHKDYQTAVQRIKIECEAWRRARVILSEHPFLAQKYSIHYDQDFVEDQLDTYRNWLHHQSICKFCGLSCFQTPDGHFHCPRCNLLLQLPSSS